MRVALWAEVRRLSEVEGLSGRGIAQRLHCGPRAGARPGSRPACPQR
jgi:hypothetical protein